MLKNSVATGFVFCKFYTVHCHITKGALRITLRSFDKNSLFATDLVSPATFLPAIAHPKYSLFIPPSLVNILPKVAYAVKDKIA